ncbi:MAG: polysaccharide biosynthesis/export family protein [Candidatus Gastranaerophilales bacterium]|nr:polysaccharide biosynthesis/export family protein [Candidatus Gastranaerophilales bacterium]
MGSKKFGLALAIILAFSMSLSQVKAEDASTISQMGNNNLTKTVDVEKFKQDLEAAAQETPSVRAALKAKVKTLSTRYLLSPGDSISLSVYGESDFAQPDILVRPDGFATIEPFGEINVAGLSVDELTDTLKTKFKTYLLAPKVSVKVNTLHSAKIYVYGAVQRPGLYQQAATQTRLNANGNSAQIIPEMTVASIISNAGGIKLNADLRHIRVINNETNRDETVDLMKMVQHGDVNQDIYLRSGDSIYIPSLDTEAQISDDDFMLISSSSLAPVDFPVRVTGAVSKPGVYNVSSNSPRLNSALAFSQGYTPEAKKNLVAIQRLTNKGNVSTFYVNPNKNDVILRPNDLIVVPETSSSAASKSFGLIADILSPVARFGDGFNSWAEMFNPTRRYPRNLYDN